jgi:peptidoglycan/LPS O-acetylase OafA/YrhL
MSLSANPQRSGNTRSNHRPDIQGLRAIAVILVVFYHSKVAFTGGFLGVDVFFVISGFVISEMIAIEISATGFFSPNKFLTRRLKRLFPALVAMISAVLVFSVFFESWMLEQSRTRASAIAAVLSISNWKFATDIGGYFDIGNELNPLLHTWSLGVEEQFYLVVPIVVALGLALFKRFHIQKRYMVLLLGFVATISIAVQILFSLVPAADVSQFSLSERLIRHIGNPFYGTPSRAWEFLAGVAGCLFARSGLQLGVKMSNVLQGFGVFTILIIASLASDGIPKGSIPNIAVVFATVVVLVAGANRLHPPNRFQILGWKPLVWIGDRSYGWYLWHWPFIVFSDRIFPTSQITKFAAALVSLIPAAVSFRVIENPLRKWTPLRNVTVVARVLPIAIPVLLLVVVSGKWITPHLEKRSGGQYSSTVEGCKTSNTPCIVRLDNATETILLEGDSHALSLSGTVVQIARELNLNLVVCIRQCTDLNPIEDLVKEYSISSVISMRQHQSIPSKTFDDLVNYVSSHTDLKTILLADNPRLKGFWEPPTLLGKKARAVSLQFVLDQQRVSIDLLTKLDKSVPNITVIPTLDYICFDQQCPIKIYGKFIYWDNNHLSVTGAALLYQPILEALNKK